MNKSNVAFREQMRLLRSLFKKIDNRMDILEQELDDAIDNEKHNKIVVKEKCLDELHYLKKYILRKMKELNT